MKKILLPLIVIFLFSCEDDEDSILNDTAQPIANLDPICQLIDESVILPSDSSTLKFKSYYYDNSGRIIKIISRGTNSSNNDSALFIYDNNLLKVVLNTFSGQMDTTEKRSYDEENRLIKIDFFSRGNLNRSQEMKYQNGKLSEFLYTSNNGRISSKHRIILQNDNITEIILIERNGNSVDENTQRQVFTYDDKENPYFKLPNIEFNQIDYLNPNNVLSSKLYENGTINDGFSAGWEYLYNRYNYPIQKTLTVSNSKQTSYLNNVCLEN